MGSFHTLNAAHVAAYIHPGNRLATLVDSAPTLATADVTGDASRGHARALNEDSIPADLIEKEKAIGKELAIQEASLKKWLTALPKAA